MKKFKRNWGSNGKFSIWPPIIGGQMGNNKNILMSNWGPNEIKKIPFAPNNLGPNEKKYSREIIFHFLIFFIFIFFVFIFPSHLAPNFSWPPYGRRSPASRPGQSGPAVTVSVTSR